MRLIGTPDEAVMKACVKAFLAALSLAMAANGAAAQSPPSGADADDAPLVLAAQARVTNPLYRETVLLVAPFGGDRHIGVIINRPTHTTLGSLFPDDAASQQVHDPVYYGGPMRTNALVALVKGDASPGGRSLAIGAGLYLALEKTVIDSVLKSRPNDGRYFVGLVIWLPGELREELRQHYWHVPSIGPEAVLNAESGRIWRDLVQRARVLTAALEEARQ